MELLSERYAAQMHGVLLQLADELSSQHDRTGIINDYYRLAAKEFSRGDEVF